MLAEGSPGMFQADLLIPGSLAKRFSPKSRGSAFKPDASREILRPTKGLRMTDVSTAHYETTTKTNKAPEARGLASKVVSQTRQKATLLLAPRAQNVPSCRGRQSELRRRSWQTMCRPCRGLHSYRASNACHADAR